MSYWLETEQGKVIDYGDIYYIDCPYCEKDDYNVVSENYTCEKFIEKSNSEINHN